MSPLQLPRHQPELHSSVSHCPCPRQSISQSVTSHIQSITSNQFPRTDITRIPPSTSHCLTKPSDVEPSLCHDPSIIDHQSANPSRCPTAITDIGTLLSIQHTNHKRCLKHTRRTHHQHHPHLHVTPTAFDFAWISQAPPTTNPPSGKQQAYTPKQQQ
jgi:hypothetical protein